VLAIPATNTSVAHAAPITPNTDTTHCATLGTNIDTIPLSADGITLGYIKVYYNNANGYNCAETISSSTTNGQNKYMTVQLIACQETSPSNTCTARSYNKPYDDYDADNYSYYAGPVGVDGTGHCISIYGKITWNGHDYYYHPGTAVHCA
jgi:hypothetical protein